MRKKLALTIMFLLLSAVIIPCLSALVSAATNVSVNLSLSGSIEPSKGDALFAIEIDSLSSLSDSQLSNLAQYDLLITNPDAWNRVQIEKLQSLKPSLQIFGYRNIGFVDAEIAEDIQIARANNWILKDAQGNEVYAKSCPQLKFADVGNTGYQQWRADQYFYQINNVTKINGIFMDGTSALIDEGGLSARPIDPRTGLSFSDQDYSGFMVTFVSLIKQDTGKLVIANGAGLYSGSGSIGFWQNQALAEPLLEAVDGVLIEGFIRWDVGVWRTSSEWNLDIQYLSYVNSLGKLPIAWTITWGTLPNDATASQISMYSFCSYMLGKSGDSYFCDRNSEGTFYNQIVVDAGTSLETYHAWGNTSVYSREYSKALFLVNPTDVNITIQLDKDYTTLNGQAITTVTITPHSGNILLK